MFVLVNFAIHFTTISKFHEAKILQYMYLTIIPMNFRFEAISIKLATIYLLGLDFTDFVQTSEIIAIQTDKGLEINLNVLQPYWCVIYKKQHCANLFQPSVRYCY